MSSRSAIAVALGALLCAVLVSREARAQLADLSGTYEGKITCKSVSAADGSKSTTRVRDSLLLLNQLQVAENGTAEYGAVLDGVDYGARATDFEGRAIGALVRCGSDDSAADGQQKILLLTIKANANKTKIRATGFFNDTEGAPDTGAAGACNGKWKRIEADEPNAFGCD